MEPSRNGKFGFLENRLLLRQDLSNPQLSSFSNKPNKKPESSNVAPSSDYKFASTNRPSLKTQNTLLHSTLLLQPNKTGNLHTNPSFLSSKLNFSRSELKGTYSCGQKDLQGFGTRTNLKSRTWLENPRYKKRYDYQYGNRNPLFPHSKQNVL